MSQNLRDLAAKLLDIRRECSARSGTYSGGAAIGWLNARQVDAIIKAAGRDTPERGERNEALAGSRVVKSLLADVSDHLARWTDLSNSEQYHGAMSLQRRLAEKVNALEFPLLRGAPEHEETT